jgi:hypothetical protein
VFPELALVGSAPPCDAQAEKDKRVASTKMIDAAKTRRVPLALLAFISGFLFSNARIFFSPHVQTEASRSAFRMTLSLMNRS